MGFRARPGARRTVLPPGRGRLTARLPAVDGQRPQSGLVAARRRVRSPQCPTVGRPRPARRRNLAALRNRHQRFRRRLDAPASAMPRRLRELERRAGQARRRGVCRPPAPARRESRRFVGEQQQQRPRRLPQAALPAGAGRRRTRRARGALPRVARPPHRPCRRLRTQATGADCASAATGRRTDAGGDAAAVCAAGQGAAAGGAETRRPASAAGKAGR